MLLAMPTGNPPTAPPSSRIAPHALAGLLGLGNLAIGIASFMRDVPGVLVAALLIAGVVMPVLAGASYRGSRAAWAFLVTICAVFAVTYTFGAPKIAHTLSISLRTALIAPGLYAAAAYALGYLHADYATSEPTSA